MVNLKLRSRSCKTNLLFIMCILCCKHFHETVCYRCNYATLLEHLFNTVLRMQLYTELTCKISLHTLTFFNNTPTKILHNFRTFLGTLVMIDETRSFNEEIIKKSQNKYGVEVC